MQYENTDITLEIAQNALSYCNDYNDREEWIRMGMALKSEFGADAFDAFDGWSQNYSNYKAADVKSVWKSFKGSGIKIGTLIDAALKQGFKFEVVERTPEEKAQFKKEREAKALERDKREKIEQKKQDDYRENLCNALTAAVNETDGFSFQGKCEYLDNKKVGAFGVLFPNRPLILVNDDEKNDTRVIVGHSEFNEFMKIPKDEQPVNRVVRAGAMMIPLYDEHFRIWNLQVIYNTGTKRFLKGKVQGCFHIVGQLPQTGRFNIAFSEGYANAAAIHQALQCPVVVCFNAGNIKPVTQKIKDMYGERISSYLFCADDDSHLEKNKGVMKANEAAALVDGLVVLPVIDPIASKEDDTDSLYPAAVEFVVEKRKVSISAVQRELRIGYNRAARLVDIMQNKGVVSEPNEKGRREVLIVKNTEK